MATQAYRDLRWLDRDTLFTGEIIEKLAPDSGFSPFAVWTGEGWSDVSRGSDINAMFDTLITIGLEQNLSAIVLQPDMQIFMNPGNGASGAAYVVGARVEVNF